MHTSDVLKIVTFLSFFSAASGCTLDGTTANPTPLDTGTLAVEVEVDIETAHPYENHTDREWTITAPESAVSLTLTFDRFETESGYDFLYVLDGDGVIVRRFSGDHTGESVTVEGQVARLLFRSDYSVTDWGFRITSYDYEMPSHPSDRRPYCGAIGSRSEGWYWGDTEELIRFEACADLDEPECRGIGGRGEGWYSNGDPERIVGHDCRNTIGVALAGEICGPSIGVTCHGDLYCQGLEDGVRGGTGTCRPIGSCETDADCLVDGNGWIHPMCVGTATCDAAAGACRWECTPGATGTWSWTTILLRDVESAHPYANDFDETWDVVRPGADRIRVHFQRIETEAGYDRLVLSGDREEVAVMVEGVHDDYWSPELGGDTLHITLQTDFSVTRWGFRADLVSFYALLPEGQCNRDDDCEHGLQCNVPYCFNPYEPCFGTCARDDHCDDGPIRCRMMIPNCDPGLIVAHQSGCYVCVDPETCAPPTSLGGEGDPCDDERPCDDGLRCKAIDEDDVGECRGELWCSAATVEADCAEVIHPAIPGQWACGESQQCAWEPTLVGGSWVNDETLSIPDDDANGIVSELHPAGLTSCDVTAVLDLSIRHTYRGDLVVGLTDPAGHRQVVHDRAGAGADDLILEGFPLDDALGTGGGNGTWTLDVSDHARYDVGDLVRWGLHLTCR